MRSLSVGVILYIFLIVAVIFCGPLSNAAIAQPGIVLGVVVGENSLVNSSEHGQQLSAYLEKNLSVPVKVRSFTTQDQLFIWLTRYREVDIAWFHKDFLSGVPAGELFTLTSNIYSLQAMAPGEFVANQGVDADLRKKLEDVFLALDESPSGRQLLTELGVRQEPPASQPPAQAAEVAAPSVVEKTDVPVAEPPESSAEPVADQEAAALSASVETGLAAPTSSAAGEEPIELVADYLAYNAAEDFYEAKGNVVLRREGVELKSDQLLWQSATQDASATGSITLQDGGVQVSGENLQYNLATGQGQVQQGKVFVREGNFHLAGEEIERHGHADYLVRNGSFTTCDGEIPDWKFSAEEVDVTLGGYATAKNVVFHIKDIPVLYTPYLFFPVKTERESGLLTPWFGYSNNKGVRASLAWYQVIDRHMDATFYLDYLSEIALGKGLEYRYALANENKGEALYYHVTGFSDVPDMYHLQWRHRGNLPGQWQLTGDIDYTDKQMFFDEFGEVAEDYNRDKTVSTVMLQRNWQKLNLVAHGRYIKDLEVEDNDSVLQRLPELGLALASYRLGATPIYLGLESYATRFWREDGEDGERLYLKPSLAAVLKPGSWLEIAPEVALHGRLYDTDVSNENEFIPEFNLTLATRLQKSFAFERWGNDRLLHSIEPKVRYVYIPEENQSDLPEFDLLDRIEPRNAIEYALINRLIVRSINSEGLKNYRDFMYLRLSQAYDVDEARNNTSGNDQPFSDVRVEFEFSPTSNVTLDAESLIPVYGATRFRTARAGVLAKDDSGNAVELDYNYKDEEFAEVANDYLRFRLDTALFKPLYLRLEDRYDFRESRELERTVGLEYRAKCWSLLLTYRNRYREDGDNDHEVMVNFVLAGLGQNKGFGNSFDSVIDR